MPECVDKYGISLRAEQAKLYSMCHKYLNDNFHKFSETNKIKVSLSLAGKMAPVTQKLEGEITFNKTPDILLGGKPLEYEIGSRIAGYTKEAADTSS